MRSPQSIFRNLLEATWKPLTTWAASVSLSVSLGMAIGMVSAAIVSSPVMGDEQADANAGYELLVNKAFLPPDFDEEIFDQVWRSWPRELRKQAEQASPDQRRKMAMERYGLTPRPGSQTLDPLQYVVSERDSGDGKVKQWTMNCFSCHGGTVYGVPTPGAPNNRYALQTMTEELRMTKLKLGRPFSRMDLGAFVIPLGTTHGTTNAVVFGVGLMAQRDTQLNVIDAIPEAFTHHDMDAPPWWHFHKRSHLYIDGFAQRGHRGLMQFMLVPENGPEFFRDHEDDFRKVYAYLMSLRAPKYTGKIDASLADRGQHVFNQTCSQCHGTYGKDATYPEVRIPLDEIGTDPVRLSALPVAGRAKYAKSWFAHGGETEEQQTVIDPDGYVAPPLDGVWASAPYFHNGSVPTLHDVLNPDSRPKIWHRTSDQLDETKVGLTVATVPRIPFTETDIAKRREYFDTSGFGKSNQGHPFAEVLSAADKQAVLEYLKTL